MYVLTVCGREESNTSKHWNSAFSGIMEPSSVQIGMSFMENFFFSAKKYSVASFSLEIRFRTSISLSENLLFWWSLTAKVSPHVKYFYSILPRSRSLHVWYGERIVYGKKCSAKSTSDMARCFWRGHLLLSWKCVHHLDKTEGVHNSGTAIRVKYFQYFYLKWVYCSSCTKVDEEWSAYFTDE